MKNKFSIFLKGLLMGVCDLIPGISGGTIAFITGIYQRLIDSVKNLSQAALDIFSFKKLKKDLKKADLLFLFILLLGIATAFLLGSRVIKFLLEEYFIYTISFFIGLILASSKIIFNHIENHKMKNILFGFLGLIVGGLFAVLIPLEATPSLPYVFLGGFLGISAMFLPGISGAFILLIMGLYEFLINVLHDIPGNIKYFLVFALGAILGAFTISRIVSFLFKKDRCKTLYFLLGLVIGALSIPVKKVVSLTELNALNIFTIAGFIILGILTATIVDSLSK